MLKNYHIFVFIFIALMAISAVSAQDTNTTNADVLNYSDSANVNESLSASNLYMDVPDELYYVDDGFYDYYPYDYEVNYGYDEFEGYFKVYDNEDKLIFNEFNNGTYDDYTYSLFELFTKGGAELSLGKYTLELTDINSNVLISKMVKVDKTPTVPVFGNWKGTVEYTTATFQRYIDTDYGYFAQDASGVVNIIFNGKTYSAKVKNGYFTITLKLPQKGNVYKCKIKYGGDSKYQGSESSFKITLAKLKPKLTAPNKTFKVKSTKQYAVILKNNYNKVMKNVKITLKVKGKKYVVKTNSKGKAIFKLNNLNKKGTFKASINYAGNSYYSGLTKNVKIVVK